MHEIRVYLKRHKAFGMGMSFVLAGIGSIGLYYHITHQKLPAKPLQFSQEQLAQHKVSSVVDLVGKQIKLPEDEQPVVATVSDREKLQTQQFFKEALNGDKILIYRKNKKAFLYRPSSDRVIAQAPLQFQDTTPTPEAVAGDATQSAQTSSPTPEASSPRRHNDIP